MHPDLDGSALSRHSHAGPALAGWTGVLPVSLLGAEHLLLTGPHGAEVWGREGEGECTAPPILLLWNSNPGCEVPRVLVRQGHESLGAEGQSRGLHLPSSGEGSETDGLG